MEIALKSGALLLWCAEMRRHRLLSFAGNKNREAESAAPGVAVNGEISVET